jgi:histidine triad (HIT) family protein
LKSITGIPMVTGGCIFCEIIASRAEASIVFRDEICTAFMDIRPVNPGHTLVVPNRHAANLAELDEESGGRIFQVGQRVARALRRSGLRCEGVNLFLADGEAAGQEVFHVHLHVFPRYRGDGFGLKFSPAYFVHRAKREELEEVAGKIRGVIIKKL